MRNSFQNIDGKFPKRTLMHGCVHLAQSLSSTYKNPDLPNNLIVPVAMAIGEAHERMQPKMLGIVDMVSKPPK